MDADQRSQGVIPGPCITHQAHGPPFDISFNPSLGCGETWHIDGAMFTHDPIWHSASAGDHFGHPTTIHTFSDWEAGSHSFPDLWEPLVEAHDTQILLPEPGFTELTPPDSCLSCEVSGAVSSFQEPTPNLSDHSTPTRNEAALRQRKKQRQPKCRAQMSPSMSALQRDPSPGLQTAAGNGDQRLFACPYLRMNPSQNMDCLTLKMTRPRDVKQHLQRRHFHSIPFCNRCNEKFGSISALQDHIRSNECTVANFEPSPSCHSVPPELQEKLKKPVKKTLSQEGQWYEIWNLLFPLGPRPSTPYLDTVLGEGIGLVERLWSQQGETFSAEFLENQRTENLDAKDLKQLFATFLEHVKNNIGNNIAPGSKDTETTSVQFCSPKSLSPQPNQS